MDVRRFWDVVMAQDSEHLSSWFADDAVICWHCTNEKFTVAEYIKANCEYPGDWKGEIERIERSDDLIVLAGRVYPPDEKMSFHVVSFIRLKDEKIVSMDEYWADDSEAPAWRKKMNIGRPIRM